MSKCGFGFVFIFLYLAFSLTVSSAFQPAYAGWLWNRSDSSSMSEDQATEDFNSRAKKTYIKALKLFSKRDQPDWYFQQFRVKTRMSINCERVISRLSEFTESKNRALEDSDLAYKMLLLESRCFLWLGENTRYPFHQQRNMFFEQGFQKAKKAIDLGKTNNHEYAEGYYYAALNYAEGQIFSPGSNVSERASFDRSAIECTDYLAAGKAHPRIYQDSHPRPSLGHLPDFEKVDGYGPMRLRGRLELFLHRETQEASSLQIALDNLRQAYLHAPLVPGNLLYYAQALGCDRSTLTTSENLVSALLSMNFEELDPETSPEQARKPETLRELGQLKLLLADLRKLQISGRRRSSKKSLSRGSSIRDFALLADFAYENGDLHQAGRSPVFHPEPREIDPDGALSVSAREMSWNLGL